MPDQHGIALVGGIEAGGTKFVCAVGRGPGDVACAENRTELTTQTAPPAQVMAGVVEWFTQQQTRFSSPLKAIGIGSFGPVDLRYGSPTYGHITTTPKPGWANFDIVGAVQRAIPGIPVGFDTDVNAAALGERRWGHGAGYEDFVYVTIGTGIGAGAIAGGQLVHGLVHPEMATCSFGACRVIRSRALAPATAHVGRGCVPALPSNRGRAGPPRTSTHWTRHGCTLRGTSRTLSQTSSASCRPNESLSAVACAKAVGSARTASSSGSARKSKRL